MNLIRRITSWLSKALELQLFITITSLPIFIYWGLPISYMTLVGNILFAPILTIFMFLSAIVFITELCCIPNSLIIYGIDAISSWWLWLLSYGSPSWLIGFKQELFWISFIPAGIGLMIVKSTISSYMKVFFLACLCIGSTTILYAIPFSTPPLKEVGKGRSKALILINNGKTTVADQGIFSQRSARSAIKYTLLPEIIKMTGSPRIDTLALRRLSKTAIDAVQFTASLVPIKEVEYADSNNTDLVEILKKFCNEQKIPLKKKACPRQNKRFAD